MIDHPRQVGVPQPGQQGGFVAKLAGMDFGGVAVFFDRHLDIQGFIIGLINRAHAALGQHGSDPIAIF